MRPLVAVQIIITVLHGNTRRPAGVKAGPCVCGRPAVHALSRIHGFLVAIACKSILPRERASKRANAADLSPFGCVIKATRAKKPVVEEVTLKNGVGNKNWAHLLTVVFPGGHPARFRSGHYVT